MDKHGEFEAKIGELRARANALDAPAGAGSKLIADLLAELAAATNAISEHEERFRIATKIARDVVYERDFFTGIAEFYGDFDTPHGFPKGEYPRTVDGWIESCHPDDLTRTLEAVRQGFQTGEPHVLTMRLRRRDGSYAIWLDRAVLLRDAKALPTKWVGVATDVSEQVAAETALRESETKLAEQNLLLQQRTAALRELIVQLKTEQSSLEQQIRANIDQLILPVLQKAKETAALPKVRGLLEIVDKNLRGITSSFGSVIEHDWDSLSPREVEVSRMVRNGLSSKRVAELLGISYRSVTTHRRNIRRKLGLNTRKVNLPTYLRKFK